MPKLIIFVFCLNEIVSMIKYDTNVGYLANKIFYDKCAITHVFILRIGVLLKSQNV